MAPELGIYVTSPRKMCKVLQCWDGSGTFEFLFIGSAGFQVFNRDLTFGFALEHK